MTISRMAHITLNSFINKYYCTEGGFLFEAITAHKKKKRGIWNITMNRDITSGMPACAATISNIPIPLAIVTLSSRMFF